MDTGFLLHKVNTAGNYQTVYVRRLECFGYHSQHLDNPDSNLMTPNPDTKDPKTYSNSGRSNSKTVSLDAVTKKLMVCQML